MAWCCVHLARLELHFPECLSPRALGWAGLGFRGTLGELRKTDILAWRIPWTEEPGGLLSTGSHRVGHD